MNMEPLIERELEGETEVLGENLPWSPRAPQIPHDLIWDRTRAAGAESR
jgi:hypothetical protein